MVHPFFQVNRPLVFAHRGGSDLAPENTMPAFDNGLALGADGIELDVRLSCDRVPVVHHDRQLDRTTNLRGDVASHTADELARADAAYHFTRAGEACRFRGLGVGVPTLEAVLRKHRNCRVIIEMKVNDPDCARAVLDVVRATDAVDRVCLGAFGLRVLRAARAFEPAVATSAAREEVRWALYRSWCGVPVSRASYAGYQIPELAGRTRVVSPRFVRHARRAGLGVQVWTVNEEADARRLLDWSVDALITDRPDLIVPLVRARGLEGELPPAQER